MRLKPQTPETPETPIGISGPAGIPNSGNSGISLDTGDSGVTRTDPLAAPGVIRILLSETASQHLSATGENAFVLVGKASYPDDPKRWILYLLPCSIEAANAGTAVARGECRAVKIRKNST